MYYNSSLCGKEIRTMKKLFKFQAFLAVIIIASLSIFKYVSASEINSKYPIHDAYQYPIVPGTEQWIALESTDARIKSCSIPDDILVNMTTDALAETIVTHPFFIDINCYDSYKSGLDHFANIFPGVSILLSRDDAYDSLSRFAQLTESEDYYSYATKYVAREVIHFNTVRLMEYLHGTTAETSDETRYYDTYIYTPNGSPVLAHYGLTWADHDITSTIATAYNNSLKATYPGAVEVSSIYPSYNCHSYAWYSHSVNMYWIDDPSPYISDTSYLPSAPTVGGHVIYYNSSSTYPIAHSGVIGLVGTTPSNIYETSKWGPFGLFYHDVTCCPYYSGNYVTYYN